MPKVFNLMTRFSASGMFDRGYDFVLSDPCGGSPESCCLAGLEVCEFITKICQV